MKKPIDMFIENIADISESDYGDFMRKANHYLMQLTDKIYAMSDRSIKIILDEMKSSIQFCPNWDVSMTKANTLKQAEKIKIYMKF